MRNRYDSISTIASRNIQLIFIGFFLFLQTTLQAANYKVEIDFHHPQLKFTGTKNTVSIIFIDEDGNSVHSDKSVTVMSLRKKMKTFRHSTRANVQAIVIKTNGTDAFFIDRILITKDGKLIQEHGEEGGLGWCLSTDMNDGNGKWMDYLEGSCESARVFLMNAATTSKNSLSDTPISAKKPSRLPSSDEKGWVYHNNEERLEINAEGLGRCYDIRFIDPVNWSSESLINAQRASVIDLVRDDGRRPARHNEKDYVVPKGVVFTSEIIGDSEAESKFASTSYEYENDVMSSYSVDIGVKKLKSSAKASVAFRDVSNDKGKNSSLYAFSKMYKQFYKLDLYFDDPAHQHYMNQRFWNGVKELGQGLSAEDFIKKFGTHYASSTYYGGNFFQRRTVTKSEYSYYESNETDFKGDVEGTVKKVNFKVGMIKNSRNSRGETERVAMSAAKIFTVGGDLNQYRPDLWAKSVLKNLAVVKTNLTRISDLLTAENFPEIANIEEKRALLAAAIFAAEQEAIFNQSDKSKSDFFTKKPATYKLTVTYMKCRGHGKGEPGGNSEYYGNLKMAFYNRNNTALKSLTFFKRDKKNYIDLAMNQTYDINQSITLQVTPADIAKGYITIYGSMNEADLTQVQMSTISKHDSKPRIYFRSALDNEVKKKVVFTSKYGDRVEVNYVLKKIR